MMSKYSSLSILLLIGSSAAIAATDSHNQYQSLLQHGMIVNGTVPVRLVLNNHQIKNIRLMSVMLSPNVQSTLANNVATILKNPSQKMLDKTPSKKILPPTTYDGMNGESVLDQGEWGTCATFATTGAINAMYPLAEDSEISQLCNLEVGVTINALPGADGGWQGSFGYLVLNQINQYGYINQQYQKDSGCGGLKEYPTYSQDNGNAMTIDDFTAHSLKTFTDKDWTPIISYNGSFRPIDPAKAEIAVNDVKRALYHGYRVVFGSLIDGNVAPVGAAGSYDNVKNDTWVMTTEMQNDIKNGAALEGHEIIIDGYDDKACATYTEDQVQKTQCGLFRIRNSWSDGAGDKGDYYMSYDHFKGMVIEAYAIGQDVKDKFKSNYSA